MRILSELFRKAVQNGGPFYAYAVIKLANNTELNLSSQTDFFVSGNKYDHSFTAAFPIGEAACKSLDIGINNFDDKYSPHDFDNATITLYTEIGELNSTERLQEGIFNVVSAKSSGDIIEISAMDNMHKADIPMPNLSYPATLRQIVNTICSKCKIILSTQNFNNSDYIVTNKPPEMTCREMLGHVAQIAGGNAIMDYRGRLVFKSYDKEQYKTSSIISGGTFGDNTSDTVSGGTLGDSVTNSISGSTFAANENYAILSNFTGDPEISTDDIIITGVSYTYTENNIEKTEMYGDEGYVLRIDNPLIIDRPTAGVRRIGEQIVDMKVRAFSGSFSPNPALELMDTVYVVDRKGNIYQSFITSHTFNYLGYSEVANETETAEKNNEQYTSGSSKLYRQVRQDMQKDHTDWETAVEQLNTDLENASGLFETAQVQPDSSTIYYFHDKSTLETSQNIIKVTSQAIAISTDGGQTFPTGITVDGNAIVSILQSVGINADWITSGTLTVGGTNNKNGQINVLDKNNTTAGVWNNNGIVINHTGQFISNETDSGTFLRIIGTLLEIQNANTGQIFRLDRDVIDTTSGVIMSSGNASYIGVGYKNIYGAPAVMAVTKDFTASSQSYNANTVYIDKVAFRSISSVANQSTYTGNINCGNVTLNVKDGLIVGYS